MCASLPISGQIADRAYLVLNGLVRPFYGFPILNDIAVRPRYHSQALLHFEVALLTGRVEPLDDSGHVSWVKSDTVAILRLFEIAGAKISQKLLEFS